MLARRLVEDDNGPFPLDSAVLTLFYFGLTKTSLNTKFLLDVEGLASLFGSLNNLHCRVTMFAYHQASPGSSNYTAISNGRELVLQVREMKSLSKITLTPQSQDTEVFGSLRCLLESHVKSIFELHPSIVLLGTLLEILDAYRRQFLELMRWLKVNLSMEVHEKQ